MELIGTTKDGVEHRIVNGKWEPPIVVPAYLHERALRRVNEGRRRRAAEETGK